MNALAKPKEIVQWALKQGLIKVPAETPHKFKYEDPNYKRTRIQAQMESRRRRRQKQAMARTPHITSPHFIGPTINAGKNPKEYIRIWRLNNPKK